MLRPVPSAESKDQGYWPWQVWLLFKTDSFVVCVKQLSSQVQLQAIKSEAAVLRTLNSCEYIPYCFGVCLTKKGVVMEYLNIDGKPVHLYSALVSDDCGLSFNRELAIQVSVDVVEYSVYTV